MKWVMLGMTHLRTSCTMLDKLGSHVIVHIYIELISVGNGAIEIMFNSKDSLDIIVFKFN